MISEKQQLAKLLEAAGRVCDCAQPTGPGRGFYVLPEYLAELQRAVDLVEAMKARPAVHAHQPDLIEDERLLPKSQ